MKPGTAPCRPKACKGCEGTFVPPSFRQRYCDECRGKCAVEGCSAPPKARGYCGMHLWRHETHGDAGASEKINERQFGTCQVEGCERPRKTKGFCSTHYSRFHIHGHAGVAATRVTRPRGVPCDVEGCSRLSIGNGLCRMHYERVRNTGDLGPPNPVRAPSGVGSLTSAGYRVITVDGATVFEHRHVMAQSLGRPLLDAESVHHKNGDRSFNDPSNLELWHVGQPAGQRVSDKAAWCVEFLRDYPEELAALGLVLSAPRKKSFINIFEKFEVSADQIGYVSMHDQAVDGSSVDYYLN